MKSIAQKLVDGKMQKKKDPLNSEVRKTQKCKTHFDAHDIDSPYCKLDTELSETREKNIKLTQQVESLKGRFLGSENARKNLMVSSANATDRANAFEKQMVEMREEIEILKERVRCSEEPIRTKQSLDIAIEGINTAIALFSASRRSDVPEHLIRTLAKIKGNMQ